MKKLKFLLLAFVAAISVGAWAQKDVTSTYIKNATLSSLDGWTNNNFNTPQQGNNTVGYASEAYAGWDALEKTSYSLTQKITLPKGNYRLVNYSFYREKGGANDEPGTSRAYLKAGEKKVAIKTLGSITATGYANSQAEGANCFDSKMYRNTVDFSIDADDTEIEIGLDGTFTEMKSWCIAGMFELWDLDAEASESDPADMTYLITNPGFEYRDATGWTSTGNGGGYAAGEAFAKSGVGFVEKWQSSASKGLGNGTFYQEISLPAGLYEVKVKASNLEQYNGDAGGTGMFLVANDAETEIGAFNTYSAKTKVTTGKLNLGIKLNGATGNWIAFDCFELKYLGVDLDDLKLTLSSIITAAKALYTSKMNADVLQSLKDKVSAAESVEQKASAIKAITEQLQNALSDANSSIQDYVQINKMINNLTDVGKTEISSSIGKYESGEWESYDEFIEESDFYTYLKKYPKDNTDFTIFIANPEINGSTGWTCERPNGGNGPLFNNSAFEYWIGTAANGSFDYYQEITGLPNGHYNIGGEMYNSSNGVTGDAPNGNAGLYAYANNTQSFVGCTIDEDVLRSYTLEDVIVTDGTLRLGVKSNGTMGARWFVADNFTLTFLSGITETDAALIALNTVLEKAKTLIDADAVATASLKEKIAADYATYSAYTTSTGVDVIKTASTDMAAQITALNASITAYANLKAAYEPYEDNTKVETLYDEAKGVYETATKTTDEVTAYIKEFTRAAALATIESPYAGNEVAAGTFYLYNPASGKFLNGGNNWGTQMSLAQGGQPMIIAKSGTGYTIDSQISNGGNNHFVGTGGFLDAAATSFTFTNIGNNIYIISWGDGTNMYGYDGSTTVVATQTTETAGSYWQLVSADNIKETAKANGTKEKPFDVTSLIADYNFGRNNSLASSWNGSPGKKGANDNMNAEKYNTTFDVYQTLTELPNGRYLVKAQGFYRAGGQGTTNSAANAFLYANDNSTAFENINKEAKDESGNGFTLKAGEKYVPNSQDDASAVFTAGYYDGNEVEAIVIDGTLKIGFKKSVTVGSDWTIFDNVRLYYMGTASFDATLTKVGDAAYSTMYLDFPVEIPEGVEAYYVTVEGESAIMNYLEGFIPANCGVVLKAETPGIVTFTQASTTMGVVGNNLIGFVEDTEVNNGLAHYAFSYKDGEVGFYIPESAASDTDPTSKFTAKANKAYIEIATSSPKAKLNIVWENEPTGINTIVGTADENSLYNINGSRVNNNYKGIVLKAGKKFLQK